MVAIAANDRTSLTRTRHDCRLCKSSDLQKAIPLAPLPVASPNVGAANRLETAPADVYQCKRCGFLQLNTSVDPEFQYRNFKYVTSVSLGLKEHFAALIDGLVARGDIAPGKFIFEIGSNDGTLLSLARKFGARVLGIDPASKIAAEATATGIETIGDFFSRSVGETIARQFRKADVVISNNTVANLDDLDDIFDGISAVLAPRGVVVIETQYAVDVIEKTLLDVIYHEHLSYFAVSPFKRFLESRDLELFDVERIQPKGGSVRFFIQAAGGHRPISSRVAEFVAAENAANGIMNQSAFDIFNKKISNIGSQIQERLMESRRHTGRAVAYGSSVGCAALMHYFHLGAYLDALFDDSPLVNCVRTADGSIPVLSGSQLANELPSDVLVLAWRYLADIGRKQTAFRKGGGRFYRALPDLAFLELPVSAAGFVPPTKGTP